VQSLHTLPREVIDKASTLIRRITQ
jgi:hypothetical protein